MDNEPVLSYDPVQLPEPITGSDMYLKAVLVQMRVLTQQLTQIHETLQRQLAAVQKVARK